MRQHLSNASNSYINMIVGSLEIGYDQVRLCQDQRKCSCGLGVTLTFMSMRTELVLNFSAEYIKDMNTSSCISRKHLRNIYT